MCVCVCVCVCVIVRHDSTHPVVLNKGVAKESSLRKNLLHRELAGAIWLDPSARGGYRQAHPKLGPTPRPTPASDHAAKPFSRAPPPVEIGGEVGGGSVSGGSRGGSSKSESRFGSDVGFG